MPFFRLATFGRDPTAIDENTAETRLVVRLSRAFSGFLVRTASHASRSFVRFRGSAVCMTRNACAHEADSAVHDEKPASSRLRRNNDFRSKHPEKRWRRRRSRGAVGPSGWAKTTNRQTSTLAVLVVFVTTAIVVVVVVVVFGTKASVVYLAGQLSAVEKTGGRSSIFPVFFV